MKEWEAPGRQFCCFLRGGDFLIVLLNNSSFQLKLRISWGKEGWVRIPPILKKVTWAIGACANTKWVLGQLSVWSKVYYVILFEKSKGKNVYDDIKKQQQQKKPPVRIWLSVAVQASTVKTVNPSNNRNSKLMLGCCRIMSVSVWNMQRHRLDYPKRKNSQDRLSNKNCIAALFRRWQTTHNRILDVAWNTHQVKPVKHNKSMVRIYWLKKSFLCLLVTNCLLPEGFGAIKTVIFINMTTFIHTIL